MSRQRQHLTYLDMDILGPSKKTKLSQRNSSLIDLKGLAKMFKEELGISPNEFIIQERIKRAKEMLMHNNLEFRELSSPGLSGKESFF